MRSLYLQLSRIEDKKRIDENKFWVFCYMILRALLFTIEKRVLFFKKIIRLTSRITPYSTGASGNFNHPKRVSFTSGE